MLRLTPFVVLAALQAGCSLPMIRQDLAPGGEVKEPASTRAPNRFGEGVYLGVRYGRFTLGGDLDGETALVGPDDLIIVPAFADTDGLGYALGVGGGGLSAELYYEAIEHDGSFVGLEADGTLRSCGFRGRLGSPTRWSDGRLAPHLLFGFGFHSLEIPDGSTDGVVLGEGQLTGVGLDGGFGASFALHDHLTLHFDYFWRCIAFTNGSGVVGDDVQLGDNLESVEPVLLFGVDLVL